ncbi:hypothetical protein [Sediminicurvatus halobius]|uniref:Uncharacterized protein n=1 Tax=Sediminicurvatus halobius TaxID=2182432 RepID=A0A2U2MY77_9GAMM|nr:hypothetical protein [Spiribacter halobius]PWG61753.1 hypothetical protein DEM34_14910 [Spiribacter halobius]UEX76814.1 hypothetical protein LMH63_12700 [Spiribacter halobius]
MIGRILTKAAGPKVLLGVLVAAAVALALLLWRLDGAREDAEAARSRAEQYRQAHESATAAVNRLRTELDRREALLAAERERAAERAATRQSLEDALAEARRNADEAYRQCLDVRLPESVARSLRGHGGDPRAADGDGGAAGVDDGALPEDTGGR